MTRLFFPRLPYLALLLAAGGCGTTQVVRGPVLDARARWALLPVMNFAETPQAGERAESLLSTLLRARGVADLRPYPAAASEGELPELDARRRYEKALEWARAQGFAYGVTGAVEEWRYRNGLEGEPAVSVSVQVIELASGRVVWSATGARSGWGRETVAGVAQKLLASLLSELRI